MFWQFFVPFKFFILIFCKKGQIATSICLSPNARFDDQDAQGWDDINFHSVRLI